MQSQGADGWGGGGVTGGGSDHYYQKMVQYWCDQRGSCVAEAGAAAAVTAVLQQPCRATKTTGQGVRHNSQMLKKSERIEYGAQQHAI